MKKEAMLYEKLEGGKVHCFLCAHHCKIADSKYGFCGVRKNEKGTLFTHVYGEVIASHVDPIEKKPLYHFFPGSLAYSIATVGCNFHCGFCQNWQISQAPLDTNRTQQCLTGQVSKRSGDLGGHELKPEEVVREAKKYGARTISYTYTEPTIFFEYAYDTAKIAKREGFYNNFVTNGYMTKDALDTIKPNLDACNVDLKSFSDDTYKRVCKGSLQPVLESIRHMKKIGTWVEVTTLVVPEMNDSDSELEGIASFIAEVGKEIPWHISRFHPNYKYTDRRPTPLASLRKAESIGKKAGLKYIYLGNVAEEGNTYCSKCGKLLVGRMGYTISENNIKNNECPWCNTLVEGIW